MISEEEILKVTGCGSNIYSHILFHYYPNQIVMDLKGNQCKPTLNPFNDNKKTLRIWKEDGVFLYRDLELPDFKGNPFDFAFLHFGLTGQPLLERLAKDMYLAVDLPLEAPEAIPGNNPPPVVDDDLSSFSFYYAPISNTQPGAEVVLLHIYKAIKGNRYEYKTRELRLIGSAEEVRKYKASCLDYVTFSGLFSKRGDKYLIRHSGLLAFDFDKVTHLGNLRSLLLNDPFFETQLMFTSPSGNGLKWIIAINIAECSHADWFRAISAYLRLQYGLAVDASGKDVSRACFLCHDPEVYINPKYKL